MTLRPEQTRALDYLKRKGTDASIRQIRDQFAAAVAQLEAAAASVPVAQRQTSPGKGRWSVHEVLDHLVESHRPAVDQLRSLLQGREPDSGAIPASLQSASPLSRRWEELLADLRRIHDSFLELLDSASDADSLDVRAPVVMVLKVPERLEWEERLDWKAFVQAIRVHTLEHIAQISRTLSEISVPVQKAC